MSFAVNLIHVLGVYIVKSQWFTGMVRVCVTYEENKCENDTNFDIPELYLINGTGVFCYCTGDLCNSAAQTPPDKCNSASQTSVGHLAISFIVTGSLLALAAARLLTA